MAVTSLSSIRRHFYVGNYTECINSAKKNPCSEARAHLETQLFLYRSYIAKGSYSLAIRELADGTVAPELEVIKLLAEYLADPSGDVDNFTTCMNRICTDSMMFPDTPKVALATVYLRESRYDDAFSVVEGEQNLECVALYVLGLLMIHRNDLALAKLELMKSLNEDCTLTQLVMACCYLKTRTKLKEAHLIIKELCDTIYTTPLLCNLQGIYYLNRSKWSKAENYLERAMQLDPMDQNVLFNYAFLLRYKGASRKAVDSAFTTARNHGTNHVLISDLKEKEREFDELAASDFVLHSLPDR